MRTNINEVKNLLKEAMNKTGLKGSFSGEIEGLNSVVVFVDPKSSPSDFVKKAEDIAFYMGKQKVLVTINKTKRLISITVPIKESNYWPLELAKPVNFSIPIGMSEIVSETEKVKVIDDDKEREVYANEPIIHDFTKYPHLIVAGVTGSGKSRMLHNILYNIISANPNRVHIIPIDFKGTELKMYEKFMPSDFLPVTEITEAKEVVNQLVEIMEIRYKEYLTDKYNNIDEYNQANKMKLNRLFLVIDEYADIVFADKKLADEINAGVIRLAQKARAAGIHIIIATQRPTVDVISGHIKANIESRIALRVGTAVDSRVILDQDGAETLLPGEFIYKLGTCQTGNSFFIDLNTIKEKISNMKVKEIPANTDEKKTEFEELKKDAEWYALQPVYKRRGGMSWLQAVVLEVDKYPETTAYDVIVNLASDYDLYFSDIQVYVRRTLEYLEMSGGDVKNVRNKGDESLTISDTYLKNWKVINLAWDRYKGAPNRNIYNSRILEQYCTDLHSKSGLWDLEEERKIAELFRRATLDQRLRVISRAIDAVLQHQTSKN